MKNKKGFIMMAVFVLILFILACALGIIFSKNINTALTDGINALGTTRALIIGIIILAVIFHEFTSAFLMTILSLFRSILKI